MLNRDFLSEKRNKINIDNLHHFVDTKCMLTAYVLLLKKIKNSFTEDNIIE